MNDADVKKWQLVQPFPGIGRQQLKRQHHHLLRLSLTPSWRRWWRWSTGQSWRPGSVYTRKLQRSQWEAFLRFGGGEPQGLSVRNAFGSSFEEPEPTPAPYRSVPNHQHHLTPFAWLLYLIGIYLLLFFLLKAPNPIRASDSVWKFTLAMVKAGLKDSVTGILPISINININITINININISITS